MVGSPKLWSTFSQLQWCLMEAHFCQEKKKIDEMCDDKNNNNQSQKYEICHNFYFKSIHLDLLLNYLISEFGLKTILTLLFYNFDY